jgi:hypothetical protein
MPKQRYYRYIITLDMPMWPRKLADDLSFAPTVNGHLLSVTDLQNDTHAYGDTYVIGVRNIWWPPKPHSSRR